MGSSLIKGCSLLIENPTLFYKKINGELKKRKVINTTQIIGAVNGVDFEFDFTLGPLIKDMFFKSYELPVTETIRNFLKPGDTFIDVGANIGYISAFALGIVGKEGEVHSFEPVPKYFKRLCQLLEKNENLYVNQCALGDYEGEDTIDITNVSNPGWCTMVKGAMNPQKREKRINVKVNRLDDYLIKNNLQPSIIKIDVEGFEFKVLKGLETYLKKTNKPPFIICEITPRDYHFLNHTMKDLCDFMEGFSYKSFGTINNRKKMNLTRIIETTDVLFKV